MDCDEHFDLNETRVNDVNSYEEMEHRDDEVFPNPSSSSSYGQTVPAEATVLSTSTSHGQSSSMGHNFIHFDHHHDVYHHFPVEQVEGRNESPPSSLVTIITFVLTIIINHLYCSR